MKTIIAHGKTIRYNEHDPAQVHAAHWLEHNTDNTKALLQEAHHDHINGKANFETNKPIGYRGTTKFHLIHDGHDTYDLGVHHHHLFS